MMNGALNMMLKGFGIEIDPNEIIAMVKNMADNIVAMRESQLRTEAMVRLICEKQGIDTNVGNSGHLWVSAGSKLGDTEPG